MDEAPDQTADTRLSRWGRECAEHPVRVLRNTLIVAIWLVALAAYGGGELTDGLTVDGSDSARAASLLEGPLGEYSGVTARIVLSTESGRIDEGAAVAEVQGLLGRLAERSGVAAVVADPFAQPGQVSADGRSVFVGLRYEPGPPPDEVELEGLTEEVRRLDGIRGEVGGVLPEVATDPEGGNEVVGVAAALVILVVVFGSLVAAGLPLLISIASLGAGFAVVLLIARVADVPSLAPQLAAMIGLGVGIDYSLVMVSRFRELAAGIPPEDREALRRAVAGTVDTAGRSVLAAGVIVVVSITGLALTGITSLTLMGVATSLCVAAAVAANLTVLPAAISLLGPRLARTGRVRVPGAAVPPDRPSVWLRWSSIARRHPITAAGASLVVLGVLAAPVWSLRLGYSDSSSADPSTTQRRAADELAARFGPGADTDLLVAVDLRGGPAERRGSTTEAVAAALRADPGVARTFTPEYHRNADASLIRFVTVSSAQAPETTTTLARLRADVVPAAVSGTGASAAVGGLTATRIDFAERVGDRLPWFVGAVVVTSLVLLMFAFGAVVVAVKAALLNLLTIAASYGVVVAAFQWGWGTSVLGLSAATPIDVYVPVFLFAISFGLSMDYEVFLIARMREAFARTADNDAAIAEGLATTARVVTSAAAVMVAVFAGFVLGADPVTKMFGVGLTAAVVIDVTVVRMVLLPAAMTLLGDANWWRPRALTRTEVGTVA